MSDQKFPRRTLLKGALLGVAAVPVSALLSRTAAAAAGRVDPNEPQAKSLGYVEDASKVDPKANPNFKPGQMCANVGRLDGKVAIVTGAARGTGAEIARQFDARARARRSSTCSTTAARPLAEGAERPRRATGTSTSRARTTGRRVVDEIRDA